MSEREDEGLGELLRDAPPERDALFRLSVIERRERQRFQRRSLVLLCAAAVVAGIMGAGIGMRAQLLPTVFLTLVIAAMAGACVLSVPGVRELVRRLRNDRASAERN